MKIKYLYKTNWILPALRLALIVGSILFVINHGHAVIEGTMTSARWFSVLLSYIVPYCVFIIGKASNLKADQKIEN